MLSSLIDRDNHDILYLLILTGVKTFQVDKILLKDYNNLSWTLISSWKESLHEDVTLYLQKIYQQNDGKIIVMGGYTDTSGNIKPIFYRYNQSGGLDLLQLLPITKTESLNRYKQNVLTSLGDNYYTQFTPKNTNNDTEEDKIIIDVLFDVYSKKYIVVGTDYFVITDQIFTQLLHRSTPYIGLTSYSENMLFSWTGLNTSSARLDVWNINNLSTVNSTLVDPSDGKFRQATLIKTTVTQNIIKVEWLLMWDYANYNPIYHLVTTTLTLSSSAIQSSTFQKIDISGSFTDLSNTLLDLPGQSSTSTTNLTFAMTDTTITQLKTYVKHNIFNPPSPTYLDFGTPILDSSVNIGLYDVSVDSDGKYDISVFSDDKFISGRWNGGGDNKIPLPVELYDNSVDYTYFGISGEIVTDNQYLISTTTKELTTYSCYFDLSKNPLNINISYSDGFQNTVSTDISLNIITSNTIIPDNTKITNRSHFISENTYQSEAFIVLLDTSNNSYLLRTHVSRNSSLTYDLSYNVLLNQSLEGLIDLTQFVPSKLITAPDGRVYLLVICIH